RSNLISGSALLGWGGWRSNTLAVLGVGAYVTWHLHAFPEEAPAPLASAVLAMVSVVLLLCFGWERPAVGVGSVLLVVVLQAHIDASYGGRGGDVQFDGTKRMGLDGNPIVARMVAETAIRPGDQFRGYVEDLYRRTLSSPSIGDELIGHWLNNWDQYDSGQTLFSWSIFDIPTISEYDPFVRPLYYAFFTRLLNVPTDRQLDNYLGATRSNNAIMALMGVRFIVTDRTDVGLPEAMWFGKFHVLEMPNPNLASYSPTRVIRVSSALEALDQLQSDTFDAQADVLVQPAEDLPALVAAPPAELRFLRSGYSVTASSPDWSLLVLPVQYSHCYVLNGGSTHNARLLRVNLVQTGLLVHGDVRLNVDFRRWPFGSPECQRQDYADAIGLRVADMQPPSS
ncbi:MAG: hypothetical protein M3069_07470, partial [Chloroflexota bacterium]|nr:hypothetical protein [Chloroflexota bacterium]